jgi:hypothetical protein
MHGKLSFDVLFSYDNLNFTLTAAGFYSVENPLRADGYYVLKLSKSDLGNPVFHFQEFENGFVSVLMEKENSKGKGLIDVSVNDIVFRRDGGVIMIGEINKSYQRGGTPSNYYSRLGPRPITDYFFDDVFVISVHPDGSEHWKIILHKKQYSQGDDAMFSSYFLAKTPSNIRLFYNEEITKDNQVSEFVIQGNGNYERNAIMSTERLDIGLRFRDAVQSSSSEIFIPSERQNQLKLVKIKY